MLHNSQRSSFEDYSVAPRFRDVLRWRLIDKIESKNLDISEDIPFADIDTELLKKREDYLLWVGHSTLLLNIKGKKILIDPVFSDRLLTVKRIKSLNYSLKDIVPVDYVLISHNHIDHIETKVLKTFKNSCRYLIPAGLDYYFLRYDVKNYITFDWYESFKERDFEFIFVPAQHWSQRGIFDRNRSLWGGWIIKSNLHTLYFAGDTGYFDIFNRLNKMYGRFDISILPIGAYSPRWFTYKNHMSPYDALRAFTELNADKMLPVHWGTFRLGKERSSEPIRRLLSLWEKEKIEEERLIFLPVGGLLSLTSMTESALTP